MPRSLPECPQLEHLKKEAKNLLKRQRQRDNSVCAVLKHLPEFRQAADGEILDAKLTLAQAQQAVAIEYGYRSWAFLKKAIEVLGPAPDGGRYFEDYRWRKGEPVGIDAINKPAKGKSFFRFIAVKGGVRVEQYDKDGCFERICHDPKDSHFGERKRRCQVNGETIAAFHIDQDGRVVAYERYFILSKRQPITVRCEVYNADGRLLEIHTPKSVSETAQDIVVTDCLGKLEVILHHAEMDKGEPCSISEDWSE